VVEGNYIGLNAAGSAALGNGGHGVDVYSGPGNPINTGNIIGAGNVISGNGGSGVFLENLGTTGNWVQGNRIGTDVTGSFVVSNTWDGVTLSSAPGNWIGPSNLISGNGLAGVAFQGSTATNNLVTGNWIGTDVTGNLPRPNFAAGVSVLGSNGNQIGGTNSGTGNVISGNTLHGIQLLSGASGNCSGTRIQGNFIGVNASGTSALGNGFQGVFLSGASSNLIGGQMAGARNIISGNASNGIFISQISDTNNFIQGNYIGTDLTGLKAIGNGLDGVQLQACANWIGGPGAGYRNVISGNAAQGVFLVGSGGNVTGNVIQGNYIGLDSTGNNRLPNVGAGLGISDAATNQIGGTSTGAGNVISANSYYGIFLTVSTSTGNQIQGNFIGTDATGTQPRGNAWSGILLQDASTNLIGGCTTGAGNLISANSSRGIYLYNSMGNLIQGNFVGTDISGTNNLGNTYHGIECDTGCSGNTIGGTNILAGNLLAYAQTTYAGVRLRDGTLNNLISDNSIFSNGGLGIDLGNFGPNSNLGCESGASSGNANFAQNFPVLTNVVSGASTRIRGYLNSGNNKTYRLQFFTSAAGNAAGYGEGKVFLGEQKLTLGNNCSSNFSMTLPATVPAGWVVTATAMDPANNTSEFSAWLLATNVPPIKITAAAAPGQQTISWTNSGGTFTLQQTLSLAPPINWLNVTTQPVLANKNFSVTVSATNADTFYRLLAP
jgi:titin